MACYPNPTQICFICTSLFSPKCKEIVSSKENVDTNRYQVLFKYVFNRDEYHSDDNDNKECSEGRFLFKNITVQLQQTGDDLPSKEIQFCSCCDQLAKDLWCLRRNLEVTQIKILDKLKRLRESVILGSEVFDENIKELPSTSENDMRDVMKRFQTFLCNNETWLTSLELGLWTTETETLPVDAIVKDEPPETSGFDDNSNHELEEELRMDMNVEEMVVWSPIDDNYSSTSDQVEEEEPKKKQVGRPRKKRLVNSTLSNQLNSSKVKHSVVKGPNKLKNKPNGRPRLKYLQKSVLNASSSSNLSISEPKHDITIKEEPNSDIEDSTPLIKRSKRVLAAKAVTKKEPPPPPPKVPKKKPKVKIFPDTQSPERVLASGTSQTLQNPRTKLRQVEIHRKTNHKNLKKCQYCNFTTNRVPKMEVHLKKHHETPVKHYECPECIVQFTTEHLYWIHMNYHIQSIKCDICNKPVAIIDMKIHLKTHQKRVFPCRACSYVYGDFMNLLHHTSSMSHSGVSLHCGLCPKGTPKDREMSRIRQKLYKHLYEVHNKTELIYQCDYPDCSRTFFGKQVKDMHMKTHLMLKIPCSQCPNTFTSQNGLELHIRNVHEKKTNYCCDVCNETFIYDNQLNRHKIEVHGAPKFKCEVCNKELITKDGLAYHLRTRHGIGAEKHVEKQLFCPTCFKSFPTVSRLNKHTRTHTESKDFTCEVCGFLTSRQDLLTRHKVMHAEVKRHACPHCPKRFAKSNYLQTHIRVHTKERPFQCEECGSAFSQRGSLKIHKKRHMEEGTFVPRGPRKSKKDVTPPPPQVGANYSAQSVIQYAPQSNEPSFQQ